MSYTTIAIDKRKLMTLLLAAIGIKYRMGSKPKPGAIPLRDFKTSDCSGFVRWLFYGASGGAIQLGQGSWYQQEWCKNQRFKPTAGGYAAGAKQHDGRLRIAFINGRPDKAGHVWLTHDGQTIESWGGHGVGRRPWDTPVLVDNVDACYVLTE